MIDLQEQYLTEVKEILNKVLKGLAVKVYLFGSRAKGTARKTSDIDIALDDNGKKSDFVFIAEIKYAFEESNIPYTVDIIDLNDISDSFKSAIEQDLIEIQYK